MKKKIFVIGIVSVILVIAILWITGTWQGKKVQEKEIKVGSLREKNSSEEYDVYLYEDSITFQGENGSAIIYTFENDHLANVLFVITLASEEEAEHVKNEYQKEVGEGMIDRVVSMNNVVSVRYDPKYFESYQNMTRAEIEEILLQDSNAKIIYEEGKSENE